MYFLTTITHVAFSASQHGFSTLVLINYLKKGILCIIWSMKNSSPAANKLRVVLREEKSECNQQLQRYKSLTQKIADYQVGIGPAPTEEEFAQWLTDVKHAVDLKIMLEVR